MTNKKQLSISEKTYEKIAERAKETDFESADEYVEYILEQVIDRLEKGKEGSEETYSAEDEERVKERLRALGYLE